MPEHTFEHLDDWVTGVVINEGNLLLHHSSGHHGSFWKFPDCSVNFYEDPEQACIRCVRESVSKLQKELSTLSRIEMSLPHPVPKVENELLKLEIGGPRINRRPKLCYCFLVTGCDESHLPAPSQSMEWPPYQWVPLSQISSLQTANYQPFDKILGVLNSK